MTHRIEAASVELLELTDEATAHFGYLSAEQLNWKPSSVSWSVGQCFDHLVTIQTLYFPQLLRFSTGPPTPSAWERYSPFSSLLGRVLIRSLRPENPRKTKTASITEPSTSNLDERTIERFTEHQRDLVRHLHALPNDLDLRNVIVTSPLSRFITYSLDDCLTILIVHGHRHLGQAMRVTETGDFPGRGFGLLEVGAQPSSK